MDTATRVTPERFSQGMSIQEFVDNMQKNRDLFDTNYRDFVLSEDDERFFRGLTRPLKVMVLAEDWCGDVLRYLPVFARIAEITPNWEVRVFRRDENSDLSDLCLKEGKYRSIPVIKFFGENMREFECFIERPAAVYEMESTLGGMFAALYPDLPDALLPVGEMSDSTRELYIPFVREFRAKNNLHWQQLFVDEIKSRVAE